MDRSLEIEAVRCAPWTRAQGALPVGSAGTYDRFLLVEQPGPWPPDVGDLPALSAAATKDPRTRVLAVGPADPRAGELRIVDHRRTGSHAFAGTDHLVPADRVAEALDALLSGRPTGGEVGPSPRDVLVCAHGRRDRCCGNLGTRLHAEVARRWPDVRVWRCSHTGGHRYAPTGITFPEGRFWGFLDAGVLDAVVRRSAPVTDLIAHDRGTSALDAPGQVVEQEVFRRLGWPWLDHQLGATHSAPVEGAGRRWRVELDWVDPTGTPGHARGEVAVTRDLPVPACGQPLGAASKTSPELALVDFELAVGGRR